MTKTILKFVVLFVVLVLCQVIVFNHLVLWGVAVPLVFIYWILKLPVTLNVNWTMTFAFLMGFLIDIFSDTRGMNSLACTILAVARMPVLRLFFPREYDLTDPEPSIRSLGPAVYMKYLISTVVLYCMVFFIVESMTFFNISRLILCITGSSILTFILILALDSLTSKKREKRL